ncbi:S49 family peptidase [Halorientalis regularis]|jgi:protease-4|uniref:Protease-4 n=1 Tax=Halorientalis regularis TaxID=660518 RepID=A0A1G7NT39_9EURY|nr:S49 family peptidase [Halorientalis regularis]SDF77225.1 protease-4 [Halorientalis regularis]
MSADNRAGGTATWVYVAVAVAAVLIGLFLAPQAMRLTQGAGQDTPDSVAVVPVEGPITSSTADQISANLREVRRNDSIKAVVLDVNSPGGTVPASEALYLAVNRTTAAGIPVVASVNGQGASGAYWAMTPASRIYVTPGSIVGSVGVIGTQPAGGAAGSRIITGPDKGAGGTQAEFRDRVELLRRQFVTTVMNERGDRLELSREELSYAKVYAGAVAERNGVADEIGGIDAAIQRAAENADLENYAVTRMDAPEQPGLGLILGSQEAGRNDSGTRTVVVEQSPFDYEGVETPRYLALYGMPEQGEVRTDG